MTRTARTKSQLKGPQAASTLEEHSALAVVVDWKPNSGHRDKLTTAQPVIFKMNGSQGRSSWAKPKHDMTPMRPLSASFSPTRDQRRRPRPSSVCSQPSSVGRAERLIRGTRRGGCFGAGRGRWAWWGRARRSCCCCCCLKCSRRRSSRGLSDDDSQRVRR